MKKYMGTFLILLFATISNLSYGEKDKVQIPQFHVKSKKIDPNLKSGYAKLNITFRNPSGLVVKKISVGFNDSTFTIQTNDKGFASINMKSGKYKMYFLIDGYAEIITDTISLSSKESMDVEAYFDYVYDNRIRPAKPVIYLYPEKTTEVNVKLNVVGQLGFTYPVYNDGWNLTASPDGNITMNNKTYNYLFWESEMDEKELNIQKQEGFLVATDTLLSFLENSLDQMGFNAKESADFITYWYPQMMANEKNHVQFLFNEACNTYAELSISPKPDQIYRVGMLWKEAKTDFIPESQIIPTVTRKGFTVIEWGGMEMNTLFNEEK